MTDQGPMTGAGSPAGRTELTGRGAAVLAAIVFGSAYVATSLALRSFTPLGTAMWRGALSTAVLIPVVVATYRPGPEALGDDVASAAARSWRLIVLGVSGGLGFVVAMNAAISMAGASLAAFAVALSSVLAAVLAPVVLGEALTIRALSGFALGVAGTALLTQASVGGQDGGEIVAGVVTGVGAAFSFAVFLLLSRRWSGRYRLSGPAIALSIAATTAIGLLPIEMLREPSRLMPADLRLDAVVGLAWLALGPGVLAQLLVVVSVRRVPTRSSAALLLISPVTASALAVPLLGEAMNGPQLLGAATILAGAMVAAGLAVGPLLESVRRRSSGVPPR